MPAFLSSGGLKAHTARFPFMYKGPLIQSDERRAAVGEGGDTDLGTSCRTGWGATGHPSCRRVCPAGLRTVPCVQALPTSKPLGPFLEGLCRKVCLCSPPQWPTAPNLSADPLWSNSSFPENASAAELGLPGASQGSKDWSL